MLRSGMPARSVAATAAYYAAIAAVFVFVTLTLSGTMNELRLLIALAVTLMVATPVAHAQTVSSIEGREARVWPAGAKSPIEGRIRTMSDVLIELETEAPYCGANGCVRSFSTPWAGIDRLQVTKTSPAQRMVGVAVVGVGVGLLLGPGLDACNGRDTRGSVNRCTNIVIGSGIALGGLGFMVTRRSWRDVPIPLD